MAVSEKILLFKVASEINIGKDAIVEFLQEKGFNVENKPKTLLTGEMVDSVFEHFKKEKKAAEIQREKFQKIRVVKKPDTDETTKSEPEPAKRTSDISHIDLHKTAEPESAVKTEKASPKIGLKILEKITLPSDKPTKREVTKLSIHKKEEKIETEAPKPVKVVEQPVAEVQKPAAKPEATQAPRTDRRRPEAKDNFKPRRDFPPKREDAGKGKPFQQKFDPKRKGPGFEDNRKPFRRPGDKTQEEIASKSEYKEKVIAEISKPPVIIGPDQISPKAIGKEKKKRRKTKKVAEVEIDQSETPKFKGLKILGKIELTKDADKKVKKIVKKPGEEEEDSEAKAKILKKKPKTKREIEAAKEKLLGDRKKKRKFSIRDLITDEEVDKAIKQTIADMGEASNIQTRSKMRQKKRVEREEKEQKRLEEEEIESQILKLTEFVTTADLAKMMNLTPQDVIVKCMQLGLMVSINQRLDKDAITIIADDYGYSVEFIDDKALHAIEVEETEEEDDNLQPRFPIVTIMGHVDHGKTSLLDHIRKSNIIAGEAGGITQHIGAYRVALPNNKFITFIDTPGHEAFTAMRARGAQITDIVILVIAADDSVMPQTIEAISHAQAANVPIIVAINKIDKPDANPDRIKQQLTDHNILVEEWGGKFQCVEISAKKGLNIESLLEKVLLEAEILDLRANPDRLAKATVVEAHMDKGMGSVATIIVQKGTLKIGDTFVCGMHFGKVRAMFDERSNKLNEALPSMPVRITGFDGLPDSGDILHSAENENIAKDIAYKRQQLRREQDYRHTKHVTLDDISKQISLGSIKDLNLIIKGDVGGTVEALSDSLLKLSNDEVRVNILHKGVGAITESDVMLAVASGTVIIGFQVNATGQAKKLAEKEAVDIRYYNIIYDCINEIKLALEGLLTPELKEDVIATIEVRKVFKISKLGTIAGCYVQNGKIKRNDKVRLVRDGLPIYTGTIDSLKRNKDDVKEVDAGYECGISLVNYNDIETGDIVEGYRITETKRTLNF